MLRYVRQGSLGYVFKESRNERYLLYFTLHKVRFLQWVLKYLTRESVIISAISISLRRRTMCRPPCANWVFKMSAYSQSHSWNLLVHPVAHSRIILITLEILCVNHSWHNTGSSVISSSKAIRHWLEIIPAGLSVGMVAALSTVATQIVP